MRESIPKALNIGCVELTTEEPQRRCKQRAVWMVDRRALCSLHANMPRRLRDRLK